MLAAMNGMKDVARKYRAIAAGFTAQIFGKARDGDGTRLAYDQPGTWSLKYNLVWDRLLDFGLVPEAERRREVAFYRTKAERYGVPLDNRSTLTKPEWMLWAASLVSDRRAFGDFVDRIVRYADKTPSRVPLSRPLLHRQRPQDRLPGALGARRAVHRVSEVALAARPRPPSP